MYVLMKPSMRFSLVTSHDLLTLTLPGIKQSLRYWVLSEVPNSVIPLFIMEFVVLGMRPQVGRPL